MENADKEEELPGQFTKEELDRKLSEAQKRLENTKVTENIWKTTIFHSFHSVMWMQS